MKTFKQFISSVKSVYDTISNKLRSALNSLGFGDTTVIRLSSGIIREEAGEQAKWGFYTEYVTGAELLSLMHKSKLNIEYNGKTGSAAVRSIVNFGETYLKDMKAVFAKKYKNAAAAAANAETKPAKETKLKTLEKNKTEHKKEEERARLSGVALGSTIFEDAIKDSPDLNFLTFKVVLTGDSEKGKSKADIVLHVLKDKKEIVKKKIMASLKSYKGKANISLAGNTPTSFFAALGMPLTSTALKDNKHLQNCRAFVWRAFYNDDLKSVKGAYGTEVYNAVKPLFKKKFRHQKGVSFSNHKSNKAEGKILTAGAKAQGLKQMKLFHKTFTKEYRGSRKKIVNKKMLELLGFVEGEEFYMASGNYKEVKVTSSKSSTEYIKLMDQLQGEFEIVIDAPKETNTSTMNMFLKDPDGDTLVKGNLAFGATASKGNTRITSFINFAGFESKDAVYGYY